MATTITFTDVESDKAAHFACESAQTTLNRRDESPEVHERNVRIGKLGEIAFAKFLNSRGKMLKGNEDMFTVWHDTMRVDLMDFQTGDDKMIDVKTARQHNYKYLLVPHDQYTGLPKDYYVGARISKDESAVTIFGFAQRSELAFFRKGDYPAYDYPAYGKLLDDLQPIEILLEMIPDVE